MKYLFDSRREAARRLRDGRGDRRRARGRARRRPGAQAALAVQPGICSGLGDESGWTYLASHARAAGADEAYLEKEIAAQLELLRHRRAQYTPARAPADPAARIVIVVDDGIEHVRPYADELVCLETPPDFFAVGQFYSRFPQVEDAEVVELLARRGVKPEAHVP